MQRYLPFAVGQKANIFCIFILGYFLFVFIKITCHKKTQSQYILNNKKDVYSKGFLSEIIFKESKDGFYFRASQVGLINGKRRFSVSHNSLVINDIGSLNSLFSLRSSITILKTL